MSERNSKFRVALLRCDDYRADDIAAKMDEGIAASGFASEHFKNKLVALKPNLLFASPAEKGVITHPEFFRAAVRVVKMHGGRPILMECPPMRSLKSMMQKTGYAEVAREENIEIADMTGTKAVHNERGKKFRRFEIARAFFDADIIVNLPKFKTHGLTCVTGAVKNLFGTIPGMEKSRWHMRAPSSLEFSEFLLDLYGALLHGFDSPKTMLHIMDAIIGQEGEGPGPAGTPRRIGAIIIGTDAVAVDCIAVRIAGIDLDKVFTVTSGFERNYGALSPEDIDLVGESVESLRVENFVPTRSTIFSHVLRGPLTSPLVKNLLVARPVPDGKKCTLCYQCKTICPAKAIEEPSRNRVPRFRYGRCIRCYCCMEICPEAAISLKKGRLQWLLG